MEGEKRWSSSTFGVGIPPPSEPNCFLSSNWDRNDPFHSALSSLGSSPAASNAGPGAGDGFVIRELFGRLGSMCNSGETSPQSCKIGSSNNTPLNSPPKLNLSETRFRGNFGPSGLAHLNTDRGSVERAAKFSCSGTPEMGYGSLPKLEPGNLSRVSSNNCMNYEKNGGMGDSPEGSSVSEQNPVKELGVKAQSNTNSRKRKAIPKAKAPVKEEKVGKQNDESSCAKRSKPDEDANKDDGNVTKDTTKNKEAAKPPEPPKDYIHVRARRGQATDSHSLAERVRREKISERMKFLQDLVPGCNKVTGKAVVLDEIINYVQSLQRQVEFLSMKLATVNPRMDVSMEALLSKDILQLQSTVFPIDSSSAFPYGFHPQQIPMPPNGLHGGNPAPFSLNPLDQIPSTGLCGDSASQIPSFWEDDLHSIVQMGLAQNHRPSFQSADTTQMKTEL